MGRKTELTDKQKKRIVELRSDTAKKWSIRAIAKEVGASKSQVNRYLKKVKEQNADEIAIMSRNSGTTETTGTKKHRPPLPKTKPPKKKKPRTKKKELPGYAEFIDFCEANKKKYPELCAKFIRNRKKWKSPIGDVFHILKIMTSD